MQFSATVDAYLAGRQVAASPLVWKATEFVGTSRERR